MVIKGSEIYAKRERDENCNAQVLCHVIIALKYWLRGNWFLVILMHLHFLVVFFSLLLFCMTKGDMGN